MTPVPGPPRCGGPLGRTEYQAGQRAWARLLADVVRRAIPASGVPDERRRTA